MRRDDAELAGGEGESNVRKRTKPAQAPRVMDREVPLRAMPEHAALHGWLDGELEQSSAREAEGSLQVDLWAKINAESEMLRRRTTPVYVQKAIMSALPDETPSRAAAWWAKRVAAKPTTVFLAAAGAAAIGALAYMFIP
jgi:hypothetical protein